MRPVPYFALASIHWQSATQRSLCNLRKRTRAIIYRRGALGALELCTNKHKPYQLAPSRKLLAAPSVRRSTPLSEALQNEAHLTQNGAESHHQAAQRRGVARAVQGCLSPRAALANGRARRGHYQLPWFDAHHCLRQLCRVTSFCPRRLRSDVALKRTPVHPQLTEPPCRDRSSFPC